MSNNTSNLIKSIKKWLLKLIFKSSNIYQIRNTFVTKVKKRILSQKDDTKDFLFHLSKLGIRKGDTTVVQSRWNEFYNFKSKTNDIVKAIIDLIGPDGNIIMFAGSNFNLENPNFDTLKTPTNTGIICEIFRRNQGVRRSIHYNSSVCALGEDAEDIIGDHFKSYPA